MSDGQIQAKPARFIAELQSLRGLAALTVMIHHCSFYYIYAPGPKKWAEVLFNAHAAVVVFYVLSGFVLYESLKASTITANAALRFYVRRLFRIYPALWLACALGVTYVALFQGHPFPPLCFAMVLGQFSYGSHGAETVDGIFGQQPRHPRAAVVDRG